MKNWCVPGILVLAIGTMGCKKGSTTLPTKNVPAGQVQIEFVNSPGRVGRMWRRAVAGPLDLTINGQRIHVEQSPKGGSILRIRGLAPGKYRYFLSSARDSFSPDQGELEVVEGKGTYILLFNQALESTLYGTSTPLPKAEGMPGVTAVLE